MKQNKTREGCRRLRLLLDTERCKRAGKFYFIAGVCT